MTLTGHFENGAIVFDQPVIVPDGAKVRVEVTSEAASPSKDVSSSDNVQGAHRFQSIIGLAKDLPPDASERIDEVLYGVEQL